MERSIQLALLFVLALLLRGWALAPSVDPLAPAAMLAAYGVAAHYAVRTIMERDWRILRATIVCGFLSAVVFVPSILIEYAGRTVDNGIITGAVVTLCALAAAVAAWRTARVRDAVCASTLSAMIGLLAFVSAVLLSYYLLRGSALQDRFFRTEGDYDDFTRSGMTDFNTWVMGDLFGGVFFHLLLGAVIAAAVGSAAGILAIGCPRLSGRYSPRPNTKSA
jgi:hypothetical protein